MTSRKEQNEKIFQSLNTEDIMALSTFDPDLLATVLVFTIAEIMLRQDPSKIPTEEDFASTVKEAGTRALSIVEMAYSLYPKKTYRAGGGGTMH